MANANLKNTEPLKNQISYLLDLYNSGETQKALKYGAELTSRFPNIGYIRSIIGTLCASLDDFSSAVSYYKECLKLDPTNVDCLNKLGLAQTVLGDLGEAVLSYNRSLLIQPSSDKLYGALGDLLTRMSCQNVALLKYRKATLLKPIFDSFYIRKVFDLMVMGKNKGALPYYIKAQIVKADVSTLHYNLGLFFNQKGALRAAVSNFDRAFLLKPTFAEAYNNSGLIYATNRNSKQAILRFQRALVVNPILPAIYNNLGTELTSLESFHEAFFYLKKAILLAPNSENTYINYANTLLESKSFSLASTLYRKALILNPEEVTGRHMLNAINENTTKTAPIAYVENLFNQYANDFEKHLIKKLKYNVPSLLREFYDESFNDMETQVRILDLGCGTGLSGQAFKDLSYHLTGIDISKNMITAAKEKQIYDFVIHGEICENLTLLEKQNLLFDLFICTDVLIYVGDCDEIFSMVKKISSNRSRFILSTENMDGEGYALLKSGRYAHSKNYVIDCARRYGFDVVNYKEIPIRWTSSGTIYGDIFLLEES